MVDAPSLGLWWLIRLDLALVGLGAVGLFLSIWRLEGEPQRGRTLALIGLLPFILQTAVLDAVVWPVEDVVRHHFEGGQVPSRTSDGVDVRQPDARLGNGQWIGRRFCKTAGHVRLEIRD